MSIDQWSGDVLGRRQHARYLTKLLNRQFEFHHRDRDAGAVSLALDGDWGAGKTFFVQKWALDLESEQHPVIRFDAWKHDLTDDALVGFMAELSSQLRVWTARLPKAQQAKVREKLQAFVKQAGRVVRPVAKEIAKGALRKVAGMSLDAIEESVGVSSPRPENDGSADWAGVTEKALDAFFEKTLDEHSKRQDALVSLKETLALLVVALKNQGNARLPLYILVDELDRCRPDYAIRLLEGVKHLFDSTGVCFVFSTNMTQLAHSVRAVYGEGFDGAYYLKRFFTFEYFMPDPDHMAYAQSIVSRSIFASEFGIVSGFPSNEREIDKANMGPEAEKLAASCFAKIAQAFRLDLRSQSQVLRHAEAATVEIQKGADIHALFLFFLAALFQRSRAGFASLDKGEISKDSLSLAGYMGASVSYSYYDDLTRGYGTRQVALIEVINHYFGLARSTPKQLISRMTDSRNNEGYPSIISSDIALSFFGRPIEPSERLPISNYVELIKYAGQTMNQVDGKVPS